MPETLTEKMPNATVSADAAVSALKVTATASPSASAVIDAAFQENDKLRGVLSAHLASRTKDRIASALTAKKAFEQFRPSRFSQRERAPGRYLQPGEDLPTAMTSIAKDGVDRRRKSAKPRGMRIRPTSDTPDFLKTADGTGVAAAVPAATLLQLLADRLPVAPTARPDPALTACRAKSEIDQRFGQIEGTTNGIPAVAADVGSSKADGAALADPVDTKSFVASHVHDLLANVPSPEEPPILKQPVAGGDSQAKQSIQNFELRSGASDVTSYHDFNSLQIAFDHVWSELVDKRLGQTGQDLYDAYVDLLQFVGNPVDPTGQPIEAEKTITSIDDITTLIQDASMLGQVVNSGNLGAPLSNDFLTAYQDVRQNMIDFFHAYDPTDFPTKDRAAGLVDGGMWPLTQQMDLINAQDTKLQATLPAVDRLQSLLQEMRDLLSSPYAFSVFQQNSCNFGILVTYRQTWQPEQYQVGDLVSTIPLAPREVRRYTTKQVKKTSRVRKEVANNLNVVRDDIDSTGRADRDIVDRAENHSNFKVTADGTFGVDADKIHATAEGGGDSAKISEDTKKDFHEAVIKSAHEYRQENRTELETSASTEQETTSYDEIQNPNDELTVTYLFYELQRTYRISEKIHQVQPVVLVANYVPAPHEIDDAWLIKNDWILRRVLLDDSFRPALEYLTTSFVGDELNLQMLDNNVQAQRQVVETVKAQVAAQLSIVQQAQGDLSTKMDVKGGLAFTEGFLDTVKNVFDPFHLAGNTATGTSEGADALAAYAQETLDRAEREKTRLQDQLGLAVTALQTAVDKLAAATTQHYDKVAGIDRLRLHVKENILYYMQAIWSHEPPDQRYFRVFEVKVPVPVPVAGSTNVNLPIGSPPGPIAKLLQQDVGDVALPLTDVDIEWHPLVEIADLDNVLGYKGNYAIYRLNENNCLTMHMMQDYLELSDEFSIRDPDDFANYTIDQLQDLATCLYNSDRNTYNQYKAQIRQWMIDRLKSGRPEDDRVIVPTKALYIEALVGTHPLLEDFKLLHRALDVKKAQGEVRHAELENVRLAARALANQLEDPDIDKKIVVEGTNASVTVQPAT